MNRQETGFKGTDSKETDFKPYISEKESPPEFTVSSVLLGAVLAVVFGAANAYLGLRVGLTVSASIPAAVIAMGVTHVLTKRNSILESNMVQTIGSAGESIAGGAIFTIPALFLWAAEGKGDSPDYLLVTLIAMLGGILGVLFMIPLRNSLIVKEHKVLPYPEGTACAEVLKAGEKGGNDVKLVFLGMGLAAVCKFLVDGFKVISEAITIPVRALKTEFSTEVYPALIGIGYICGVKIASYMFAGGILGWFVIIPAITFFGGDSVLYPGTEPILSMYESGGPSAIWSSYLRYVGAGMVAGGGIISLIKSLPLIVSTFAEAVKGIRDAGSNSEKRTDRNLDMRLVLAGILIIFLLIWLIPQIPVSLPGALLAVFFGFFFGTVSSRIVGLIGSSNTPVSGMTIATLLFATLILKLTGNNGTGGMISALVIGSFVCITAAITSDTSQDLKTGFLLGATPKKQQIGEIIGILASAATIGGVMILLNNAWEFGSKELSAPQASLMKMIVEGVMNGDLPWTMVFIGIFLAVVIEILRVPVLPVAIGLYLPMELSCAIMCGGVIRYFADRRNRIKGGNSTRGILFCSGMIAGEGLAGVLLAILAVTGIEKKMDLSSFVHTGLPGSIILLILLLAGLYAVGKTKTASPKDESGEPGNPEEVIQQERRK